MHSTEKIFSAHLHCFCASKNGGTGEVGGVTRRVLWTLQLLDLAVKAMVGTGWDNSCPGCMNRLRKCYSHLVVGSFLVGKGPWALSECFPTEVADYCMLINELP